MHYDAQISRGKLEKEKEILTDKWELLSKNRPIKFNALKQHKKIVNHQEITLITTFKQYKVKVIIKAK